jgi:predicted TIM-barrel fold metal-dependent hydrolase
VVIDHMGGFDVNAGVDDPGFRCLLELLASGKAWVKLCAYRNLLQAPDWQAGRPFQQAMTQANPERLLWGSDWPHLRVVPTPDAADLLALFKDWAGSDALARQVLQVNAEALYR